MVKFLKNPQGNPNTTQNNPNLTPKLDSKLSKNQDKKRYKLTSKSRQQIYQENYQKNKEKKKQQRRERYQQQKLQVQSDTQQQLSKYYGAEAIKILMSFKEYTELNKGKKKLWLDFNWTLQDCQKSFKEGFADIVMIMKLVQVADNLIRDFWDTAKSEEKQKSKSWNSLDYDQQQRLIRYWGYEKTRVENNYINEEERLKKQSQTYLKEIELVKFHEERGKIKCPCYACETKKEIQEEVKAKMEKEIKEHERQSGVSEKEQCPECKKWVKEVDEETGVCKNCLENYE